ncbi:uncharacterized protein G2W53_043022 [Senna tora]|uniref:Uncharacterized protein n=1 Tax=Senna tora TaxID=362788 RepID=A0A834SHZ2_9FABA|nr:uncharacterized protein G2W53_043022 [Senna tora]
MGVPGAQKKETTGLNQGACLGDGVIGACSGGRGRLRG